MAVEVEVGWDAAVDGAVVLDVSAAGADAAGWDADAAGWDAAPGDRSQATGVAGTESPRARCHRQAMTKSPG